MAESESGATGEDAVDKVAFSCLFSMNRKLNKLPRVWESDDIVGSWFLVQMAHVHSHKAQAAVAETVLNKCLICRESFCKVCSSEW